jgi:hypothetical protein
MPDSKLLWFLSTERMSVQVEGHTFVPDDEGYIAVPENLGMQIKHPTFQYVGRERPNKKSIEPYRPVASVGPISDAAASGEPLAALHPPKVPRRGPRKRRFWAEARAAAMRWLVDEGCPAPGDGRQAILEHHITEWLQQHGHEAGEATIRRHIAEWISERRVELKTLP